ncbi:Na+-dependent transporter SNF family [Anaeromyces robustus]|jgi:NSS family neurotransmitter:Na+ symporter|uniref:Na+-dependent transporter SNF family n=1 Tax=Anaeromyces robustus TaxID=1754192 RepID=A0A1Y1WUQ2_9FUNG|nr:Na+-dependent transporter SNF family [Anaeromyces robustus]|eukprot:ORX76946.1 Na+-dependent transporter SNF family [Anaeromyces robustus]
MTESNEWGSNLSFLLAMIGSAVGLGNIWRYPYVLYKNGGGAFYIPYIVAVLLLGIPFLILEYAVGYNFKASFAKGLRKINKKFEFLGWIVPVSSYVIMTYYAAIIGWIGIYVVLSFYKGWGENPGSYFEVELLAVNDKYSGLFQIVPIIALAMIICWVCIWFISHKHLEKGLGRISKILVPMLFIIMIFIVIYSLTLDGASIGLNELFIPKWSSLLKFDMWMAAFGQIIFSMSLGLSLAYTYAGYSGQNSDLITNAVTIAIANCGFENFCALGVFSILGHVSKLQSTPVASLVKQGVSLVFVAYPAVINVLGKFAYIIGPAFFITVFLAGLTSILSTIEPLAFSIQNKFTWSRKKTITVLIVIGGLISMLYATKYGSVLLGIVDTYINQVLILICVIFECIAFAWVFKAENTIETLNQRSKTLKVGLWWIIIVKGILPIFIAIVWVGGILEVIENGSLTQTILFFVLTIIIGGVSLIFTLVKPTNKSWDETESRL